jgi:hypothetical protein
MKKSTIVLLSLGIYFVTAGISYMFFSGSVGRKQMSAPPPVKNANGSLAFDESLPKTEPCPLNGAKYSTQQRDWWEKHRPFKGQGSVLGRLSSNAKLPLAFLTGGGADICFLPTEPLKNIYEIPAVTK